MGDEGSADQGPDLPRAHGQLAPDALAGTHETLEGDKVTITGEDFKVRRHRVGHLRQRPDRQRDGLRHRQGPDAAT